MKNSNSADIVAISNAFSGPVIILACIISSFFLLNPSDRTNILIGALGSGSAMWQHQSRRGSSGGDAVQITSVNSNEDGRGSGRVAEDEKNIG